MCYRTLRQQQHNSQVLLVKTASHQHTWRESRCTCQDISSPLGSLLPREKKYWFYALWCSSDMLKWLHHHHHLERVSLHHHEVWRRSHPTSICVSFRGISHSSITHSSPNCILMPPLSTHTVHRHYSRGCSTSPGQFGPNNPLEQVRFASRALHWTNCTFARVIFPLWGLLHVLVLGRRYDLWLMASITMMMMMMMWSSSSIQVARSLCN